jgi:hypothetical protein
MRRPRRSDRQRFRPRLRGDTEIQLGLAGGQPRRSSGIQGGQRRLIMSRTEMLDRA